MRFGCRPAAYRGVPLTVDGMKRAVLVVAERAAAVVVECALDFVLGVHYKRAVLHDWFMERLRGGKQQLRAMFTCRQPYRVACA
jgi:hypothetical protein